MGRVSKKCAPPSKAAIVSNISHDAENAWTASIGQAQNVQAADLSHNTVLREELKNMLSKEEASNEDGQVRIPVATYMRLLRSSLAWSHATNPLQSYIIEDANYTAAAPIQAHSDLTDVYAAGMRLFASFLVRIVSRDWCCVRLLPDSVAIQKIEMRCEEGGGDDADNNKNEGHIGVYSGAHCLFANRQGLYRVKALALAPYSSSRAVGCSLLVPNAVRNTILVAVEHPALEIAVEPSLSPVSKVVYPQQIQAGKGELKDGKENSDAGELSAAFLMSLLRNSYTSVTAQVPPTHKIMIQWMEKVLEEEEEEVAASSEAQSTTGRSAREVQVEAEQHACHSIGEGVVQTQASYNLQFLNGQRSVFDVVLKGDSDVRVTRVEGRSIKKWDVLYVAAGEKTNDPLLLLEDQPVSAQPGSASSNEDQMERVLKIWLDYGVEDEYCFTLHSEVAMQSTSCKTSLPTFACKGAVREKGFLSVEARTNVEVKQLSARGIARVGVPEVPWQLSRLSKHPILLAYKFLDARSVSVTVDVKKHQDVSVLVAAVDIARLTITVGEGKVQTCIKMMVRNTQTQFVRIAIPEEAEVWSTLVAGRPVKPARDEKKQLMVPLQKSTGSSDKETFPVEVVYFSCLPEGAMHDRGTLRLSAVPRVDIPINSLQVHLYLPEAFDYGEFMGDLKEVKHFSSSLLSEGADDEAEARVSNRPMRKRNMQQQQMQMPQMQQQQMQMPQMQQQMQIAPQMLSNVIVPQSNFDCDSIGGAAANSAGVMPIRVKGVESGKCFRFERILVRSEPFSIAVDYKEKKKSYFQRRSLDVVPPVVMRSAVLVLLASILLGLFVQREIILTQWRQYL